MNLLNVLLPFLLLQNKELLNFIFNTIAHALSSVYYLLVLASHAHSLFLTLEVLQVTDWMIIKKEL